MTHISETRLGSRRRPEQSRAAILQAAVREFAREGVAGARTEAIARSAGVNKALLYYYFKDKESLYQAVLDEVFSGLRSTIHAALAQKLPPRNRLTAYVRAQSITLLQTRCIPESFRRSFCALAAIPRGLNISLKIIFVRYSVRFRVC